MADVVDLGMMRLERRMAATERELADARLAIRHLAAMLEASAGGQAMSGQADLVRGLVTGRLSWVCSHTPDERPIEGPTQA